MIKNIHKYGCMFFGLLNVFPAYSVSVELNAEMRQVVDTILPLNGITISAGPDVPIGTVLYQGYLKNNQGYNENIHLDPKWSSDATQNDSFSFDTSITYNISNSNILSSSEKIYATNISGIGVQYLSYSETPVLSGETINTNSFGPYSPATIIQNWNTGWKEYNIKFRLVKVGGISPGIFDGASLGQITLVQNLYPGTKGNIVPVIPTKSLNLAYFKFTGSLEITVPSCETPKETNVDLGSYSIESVKSKEATEWRDASIILMNCPVFYGSPGANDTVWNSNWGSLNGELSSVAPNQNNKLGITLNSNQSNLDSGNGIVAIDSSIIGSAKGVAVQISRGTIASNNPVLLGSEFTQELPMNGNSSIKIPLVARIIRYSDNILPGIVHGQITYIITYK